jgi:hypothetical protein
VSQQQQGPALTRGGGSGSSSSAASPPSSPSTAASRQQSQHSPPRQPSGQFNPRRARGGGSKFSTNPAPRGRIRIASQAAQQVAHQGTPPSSLSP